MADWEYVFYDWWDHMPIDALPLQEVSMSITLSGGGQLTAAVPLYDERYSVGRVEAATIPERTMLCVFRDGRFVWGGRVVDPHDYDSSTGVLSITAEEVVGIYAARYVAFTGQRTATGWAEVKWLLEHTASAADKRWLKSFQGTGGTTTATRIYRTEDLSPLLDQVVEVTGAPTGFDWWVRPDWDSMTSRPCFALQGVGRETRERAGLVLEYPGNVEDYQRATRRGLLTRVHGKLETETAGTVLERADSPKLNIGWPLIEGSFQIDGATSRADLVAQLQRILATATGPKQIYTFDLGVSGATEWWGWELGKWARVLITDHLFPARADGSAGLDTEMQIVSVQVQPGSGGEGEKVTVQTAEFG